MIGEGPFQVQLNECERIVAELGLLEERNPTPNKRLGAGHFKRMSYREIYSTCIVEYAYDIKLADQSLLLFTKSGSDEHDGALGFSYYECPVDVVSYKDFVVSELALADPLDPDCARQLEEIGDSAREQYDEYVAS